MQEPEPVTDEELWRAAKAGDAEAEEQLIERYAVTVRMCARPYFLAGGDSEDLLQEGMIGLLTAVRRFDPNRDVTFKTFAQRCVVTRLLSAVRTASRSKHRPLNDYISFESPQFDERQIMSTGNLRDPEELVITKELTDELHLVWSEKLSGLERQILQLYLEGMSNRDIAERVGRSEKSVDNAVQRVRHKLTVQRRH